MTGEELNDEDIMSLFEAARWAPSSFNNQPWRFLFMQKEILSTGIDSSIFCMRQIKYGLKMLLY
jgi:nitroreductase